MDLPDACVVYFENTKITPDHITFRLNHKTSGRFFDYDIRVFKMEEQSIESLERRKLLVLDELEDILLRAMESGFLGNYDGIMILESISRMHDELYGAYPEFQEAGMAVKERVEFTLADYRRKLIKETEAMVTAKSEEVEAKVRAETKDEILGLFRQGYTVEEVERMLAKEK